MVRVAFHSDRAYRREMRVGCAAFAVSSVGLAVAGTWWLVKHLIPEDGWWAVGAVVPCTVLIPLLGGTAAGIVAMQVLERWRRWRGVYRCSLCDRPVHGRFVACACRAVELPPAPTRRSTLHYHWRRFRPVLAVLLLLVPLAMLAAVALPHRRRPLAADVLIAHAILCNVCMLAAEPTGWVLRRLDLGRRVRPRLPMAERAFGIWSVVVFIGLAALE